MRTLSLNEVELVSGAGVTDAIATGTVSGWGIGAGVGAVGGAVIGGSIGAVGGAVIGSVAGTLIGGAVGGVGALFEWWSK
ncbi:hypothetical protein [Pandoraea horticolens]|uniref:hypothetical protein n=1 Tax=Pandoraea horticolens TaxID=2508298 RepID=UPI001240FDC6|nr:hypothetical protein [Pandoraea horticolens]